MTCKINVEDQKPYEIHEAQGAVSRKDDVLFCFFPFVTISPPFLPVDETEVNGEEAAKK